MALRGKWTVFQQGSRWFLRPASAWVASGSVAPVLCWMKSGLSLNFCQGSLADGRAEACVFSSTVSVKEACAVSVPKEVRAAVCGGRKDASAWCACFGQVGTRWEGLCAVMLQCFCKSWV